MGLILDPIFLLWAALFSLRSLGYSLFILRVFEFVKNSLVASAFVNLELSAISRWCVSLWRPSGRVPLLRHTVRA